MKLHSAIVDDVLDNFDLAREWADAATFGDVVSPIDKVTYPGICPVVPQWIQDRMLQLARAVTMRNVEPNFTFARLSLAGVPVPHQAHNDATMGDVSLMLYLNRPEHCFGGTELVMHFFNNDGMEYGPRNEHDLALWQRDHSDPSAWAVVSRCPMRANRAFVFDAALMHRAAPIGGFGDDQRNGRLVVTGFYS